MKKSLICYFSATGTTKNIAIKIARILQGDVFEIVPEQEYTSEDLDWTNKQSRSSVEMANENIHPKVKYKLENVEDYNKIILGFPVWWYKEPTIVDTFIEGNNFDGKQVYVFVTSGGSTVDGSLDNLRKKYSNIDFVSGKRLTSNLLEDEILNWIK